MSETVCGVVVTFNRKELLVECIEALLKQTRPLDAIYIIDNASTDKTPELLKEKGYIQELPPKELTEPWEREFSANAKTNEKDPTKIHYVRMHENTGGAGGFHEGVKRGYGKGYDWLWLMDDDGKPAIDCLSQLLTAGNCGFNYIASNLINENNISHFETRFKYARTSVIGFEGGPFNAILISHNLITAIGYPMKNFIIWGDEYEYCNRIKDAGFPVTTVQNALHYHKSTAIDFSTCNRVYYIVRNKIYQYRLFQGVYQSKKYFLIGVFIVIIKLLKGLILAHNWGQIWQIIRGFIDGWFDTLVVSQKECCWWGVKHMNK